MNVSEFCCIALGMLFNVLTFFLGVAVGVTMVRKRKDSTNDDSYRDKVQYWHGNPSQN